MGNRVNRVAKLGTRTGLGMVTGGLSEAARLAPKHTALGGAARLGDRAIDYATGQTPTDNTLIGDFSISPEEVAYNKKLIMDQGNDSSGQILSENNAQLDLRRNRRAELGNILTRIADRQFMRELPNIAEDSNAKGIYTGTGYSEALARERARNTQDLQDNLSQQALTDTDAEIAGRNAALQQRLGASQNALSRQFSLEDFIRSANVAKTTGQALQPKSDGKAGTGSILQGLGALAPLAGLFLGGPAGAAAGTAVAGATKR